VGWQGPSVKTLGYFQEKETLNPHKNAGLLSESIDAKQVSLRKVERYMARFVRKTFGEEQTVT
jgi:hypothetical protein